MHDDFTGGCSREVSDDADNFMSMTGMVIMHANFPVNWHSLLQMEISLSIDEAEYIALYSALREVIQIMTMTEEINVVFPLHIPKPKFVCKFHEDNQSCIKLATVTKLSPRTKHIVLKYHHFRTHASYGRVEVQYRPTNEQLADILTKPFSTRLSLRFVTCSLGGNILLTNPYPVSNIFRFSKMNASS